MATNTARYKETIPTYAAIQWDGTNLSDIANAIDPAGVLRWSVAADGSLVGVGRGTRMVPAGYYVVSAPMYPGDNQVDFTQLLAPVAPDDFARQYTTTGGSPASTATTTVTVAGQKVL